MKFISNRPGFLWQAIIIFLILLDSIVLFLSVISNLKFITLEYIAIFDLIVSLILLTLFILAVYTTEGRKNFVMKNWAMFLAFIPLYFIAIYTGLIDYLILFKILNILKIISLYLFAQKFAREIIKYQEKTRLVYALALFMLVLFICSFVFYTVEHGVNPEVATYEDSLWFVLQTITTVGYGDIIPVTGIGRLMGVVSMFSALALTSIITSVATFSLIEKFRKGTEELAKKTDQRVRGFDKKLNEINDRLTELDEINNHLKELTEKNSHSKGLDNSKGMDDLKKEIEEIKGEISSVKELLTDKD